MYGEKNYFAFCPIFSLQSGLQVVYKKKVRNNVLYVGMCWKQASINKILSYFSWPTYAFKRKLLFCV